MLWSRQCPGKLNLGLFITGKRDDGYHLLETVFYPAPIADTLTLEEVPGAVAELTLTGLALPADGRPNLCQRAWQAVRDLRPTLPGVHIRLEKRIPPGTGLGGGSSDAAQTLLGLDALFDLRLTPAELHSLALGLGADVPYFLEGGACFATGIGEWLLPLDLDLTGYRIELVLPGVHSDTRGAYADLLPSDFTPAPGLHQAIWQPVTAWRGLLTNAFERGVFARYPALAAAKEALYARGALYASLSGSGSALYGIFEA